MNNPSPKKRPVKSYVLREGRITTGQKKALNDLLPVYGIDSESTNDHIDLNELFGRTNSKILEIGFGDGGAILQMAQANPDIDYLGLEVHRPGVGRLLLQVESLNITNIRVACTDGAEFLRERISSGSLSGINLFFPDPWHKKKHNKRRIVQPAFVDIVAEKLEPGGVFHFATDWQDYAEAALEVLTQNLQLINLAGQGKFSPRPENRPLTKFEQRGHRLGHGVFDIVMQKQSLS